MGKTAIKMVEVDVKNLLKKLNSALADEWLAYYQYWIGDKIIKGMQRPNIAKELVEHAGQELDHAEKLVKRIIELGGTPLLSPQDWFKNNKCEYMVPTDFSSKALVLQNLEAERCAIKVYQDLIDFTQGKDTLTYHLAYQILKEEIEHEQELEDILSDIEEIIMTTK